MSLLIGGSFGAVVLVFQQLRAVLGLLVRATKDERRSVVEEMLDVVDLNPHQAMAVRPAEAYAPLLRAAWLKIIGWWAGWGSDLDSHTLVKMAPTVLRAA